MKKYVNQFLSVYLLKYLQEVKTGKNLLANKHLQYICYVLGDLWPLMQSGDRECESQYSILYWQYTKERR